MNLALANFWKHPGSSLKGALGLATVLLIAWGETHPAARWCATATALATAALRFFSKDVGREEAQTPDGPQMKPAHEIPDDGSAPVK